VIPKGWHPAWWWALVIAVAALLTVVTLRGYLSPASVVDFSNLQLCVDGQPSRISS
jgi:hypothetical protein